MQPAMRRWGTGRPLRLVTAAVLATVLSMVLTFALRWSTTRTLLVMAATGVVVNMLTG